MRPVLLALALLATLTGCQSGCADGRCAPSCETNADCATIGWVCAASRCTPGDAGATDAGS